MPGPYSKPQGVSIVGGGGSGVGKKNMTKKPLRRGPRLSKGDVQRRALTKMAKAKKLMLPVWQDRDVKNRGTKLNP
jgi:hypothetical protein